MKTEDILKEIDQHLDQILLLSNKIPKKAQEYIYKKYGVFDDGIDKTVNKMKEDINMTLTEESVVKYINKHNL